MRRGVGVGYVKQKAAEKQDMRSLGTTIDAQQVADIQDDLKFLRDKLSSLGKQYHAQLRTDPIMRGQFKVVCDSLGIDMMASKRTIWGRALGVGDFYHELCCRVVEVCVAMRETYGGLVPMESVLHAVRVARSDSTISEADVICAVEKLRVFGGYKLLLIGGRKYLQSMPSEASNDIATLLAAVGGGNAETPSVTLKAAATTLGWDEDRTLVVLRAAEDDGLAWYDACDGSYWFPCLIPALVGSAPF